MNKLDGGFIFSTDLDKKEVTFYIAIFNKYYVATSLNKTAIKKLVDWYRNYFDLDKKEVLEDLLPIIKNEKDFSLIGENKEAYKQFCEYINVLPIQSSELLIEKFNEEFERVKEKFKNRSIETNLETLILFEIDFINKHIEVINRMYFNIYPQNHKRKIAPPLNFDRFITAIKEQQGTNYTTTDLIPLTKYLNELQKRVVLLINEKKEPENIIIDSDILENRTKLLLLKELGVLDILKKLNLPERKLAQLITEIIESDKSKKTDTVESVRTDLRYIDYTKEKKDKSPNNKTAINKVNSILLKYGLPIIKGT